MPCEVGAPGSLLIESAGPGATIQDAGRFGWLRFGVTPAGPMDWAALRTANTALGNDPGAAVVEIGPGGLAVSVATAMPLAFAGGAFRWSRRSPRDPAGPDLPAAARVLLHPGEVLSARAGRAGAFSYLAVPGGLDVPPVMNSRATHIRSGLGGLEGRALRAGDRLAAAKCGAAPDDGVIEAPWLDLSDEAPIRVVLGPQDDHFTSDAVASFLGARWTLTGQADRMAYKLDGPPIAHARDYNIVSDGVALGAVQVAGDGQPMVLMADRQPTGGYAKIAHVIRADIGRLAQLRPGDALRFAAVGPAEAARVLIELENRVAAVGGRVAPLRQRPSLDQLIGSNLIGGVTDGRSDR